MIRSIMSCKSAPRVLRHLKKNIASYFFPSQSVSQQGEFTAPNIELFAFFKKPLSTTHVTRYTIENELWSFQDV